MELSMIFCNCTVIIGPNPNIRYDGDSRCELCNTPVQRASINEWDIPQPGTMLLAINKPEPVK